MRERKASPAWTGSSPTRCRAAGSTLTANTANLGAISLQWQRGNADIPGATGSTLNLRHSDAGYRIRVVVSHCHRWECALRSLPENPEFDRAPQRVAHGLHKHLLHVHKRGVLLKDRLVASAVKEERGVIIADHARQRGCRTDYRLVSPAASVIESLVELLPCFARKQLLPIGGGPLN